MSTSETLIQSLRERDCSHLQCLIKFWVGAVTFNFGLALTLAGLIRQQVGFDISAEQGAKDWQGIENNQFEQRPDIAASATHLRKLIFAE